jgi:hypothetical protein
MNTSKLGKMVAILATAAGFSALAATAQAQISGSTGGNVVAQHPVPAFDDPFFFPTNGVLAAQWGPPSVGGDRSPGAIAAVTRAIERGI